VVDHVASKNDPRDWDLSVGIARILDAEFEAVISVTREMSAADRKV
jgi:hypothetical protein